SDWSREALLTQFVEEYKLNGMERDQVISFLGEPANVTEFDPGGARPSRRDTYCLSAKDEESLILDYEAQDKVTSYRIEPVPCKSCTLFIGAAAEGNKVLKREVLQELLLQKYTEQQIRHMTIKQLEAIIGQPDKSWTHFATVSQVWINFYYLWR